jgi:hypothetical protein
MRACAETVEAVETVKTVEAVHTVEIVEDGLRVDEHTRSRRPRRGPRSIAFWPVTGGRVISKRWTVS